jgi:hypothetical protein
VRSKEEILRTLDDDGKLEELPFMPEMLQFCGHEFRVRARAHKVCDTVDWHEFREMDNAVHLAELRCDGSAHGGCQAGCLLFWKRAWLSPVDVEDGQAVTGAGPATAKSSDMVQSAISEEELHRATQIGTNDDGQVLYSCQATAIPRATKGPLHWWQPGQYVQDITSGNSNVLRVARALTVGAFNRLQIANKRFLPQLCLIEGGRRYPFIKGTAAKGDTPSERLDLRPGELVEIKSREEIFGTLDENDETQGLRFDSEMLKYCGSRARVLRRIEKIIDEKTGRMLRIKRDTVILDGVICRGDYHRSCPRAIYPYWREVWLRRVGDRADGPAGGTQRQPSALGQE